MPIDTHTIAIEDVEVLHEVLEHLIRPDVNFGGFNGLSGEQAPDKHGGPVICQWMIEMGYGDLR